LCALKSKFNGNIIFGNPLTFQMIYRLLLIFILIYATQMSAQYTEVINSNTPGRTVSPYSVGTNVYQFELGFGAMYYNKVDPYDHLIKIGTQFDYRMGLGLEFLELYVSNYYDGSCAYEDSLIGVVEHQNKQLHTELGLKALIFQLPYTDRSKEIRSWKKKQAFDIKRLIPAIGISIGYKQAWIDEPYISINADPFVTYPIHSFQRSGWTYGIYLQQNLSKRITTLANLSYQTDHTLEYTFGINYVLKEKWATFVDYQGLYLNSNNENNFSLGLAYLVHKNLQLNSLVGHNFNWNQNEVFASIGLSWRIDKHKDSYKLIKKVKRESDQDQRDGFFAKQPSSYQKRKDSNRKKNISIIRNQTL